MSLYFPNEYFELSLAYHFCPTFWGDFITAARQARQVTAVTSALTHSLL